MQWEQAASESRRVACAKRISKGEHFFGFGERTGYLDKLGRQMINWTTDPVAGQGPGTDPLYLGSPYFFGENIR
jgi:alpha-glucosidase